MKLNILYIHRSFYCSSVNCLCTSFSCSHFKCGSIFLCFFIVVNIYNIKFMLCMNHQYYPLQNFFIIPRGNSIPLNNNSSLHLPPVHGKHCFTFCLYEFDYFSQKWNHTSVLLNLPYST